MRSVWLLIILAGLLLCGCPDDSGKPPTDGGGGGGTTDGGGGEDPQDGAQTGGDPLAGSLFSKDDLFEIYAAEQKGGDARQAALTKHKLIDGTGQPVPARQSAYERALKAYASGDPEGWAAFLETLGS